MIKVLGFVFLVLGAVLLYYGWQAHEAVRAPEFTSADAIGGGSSRSLWLLGLGAVMAIWGLFAVLRRNVM